MIEILISFLHIFIFTTIFLIFTIITLIIAIICLLSRKLSIPHLYDHKVWINFPIDGNHNFKVVSHLSNIIIS